MSPSTRPRTAQDIRAELGHPVIDADGHIVEFLPALWDAVREYGSPGVVERVVAAVRATDIGHDECVNGLWDKQTDDERIASRTRRPTWWAFPTRNTVDRATATFPALLAERLPELGIDYAVLYPTTGLAFPHMIDDRADRRAACRGYNLCYSQAFQPHASSMTPAAVVPMHTPEEAIEELEYAVLHLGMKAVLIPSYVSRPVGAVTRDYPDLHRIVRWLDTYGIDSQYDYDPFWRRCVELRVSLATHSTGFGWAWGGRRSISNFTYNHIGHFADAGEALLKSLFLGGVTRRFPGLRVAFLEGGVAWGARVLADLMSHWEKRRADALDAVDPANIDRARYAELFERYGGSWREYDSSTVLSQLSVASDKDPNRKLLDEWAACEVRRPADLVNLFVDAFAFGCEADDPLNYMAFSERNPMGTSLRAMLGSDIGHWDVTDMRHVVPEAYELLENGWLSESDFRDLTFTNPVKFYTDTNPQFFQDTGISEYITQPPTAPVQP